jgi:hypothetical protein
MISTSIIPTTTTTITSTSIIMMVTNICTIETKFVGRVGRGAVIAGTDDLGKNACKQVWWKLALGLELIYSCPYVEGILPLSLDCYPRPLGGRGGIEKIKGEERAPCLVSVEPFIAAVESFIAARMSRLSCRCLSLVTHSRCGGEGEE